MQIEQHQHGAVTVIKPAGLLTQAGADELRSCALEAKTRSLGRMVLDASSVAFVDSRGLEVLVDVADELARSGRALKLCGASDLLNDILRLTGLSARFEHFEDVNAAVRSFL